MATSLDALEPELVQLILEYVNDSSPRTTKAVAVVNKYLNAATKAIQHRHKVVYFQHWRDNVITIDKIQKSLHDETVLRSIHHLTVGAAGNFVFGSTLAEFEEQCEPLANVISKIGKLKTLTWSAYSAFPSNVLKALHDHHPKASLRIFDYRRSSENLTHLDHAETALSRSPALTHFRAELTGHLVPDYRLAALKRLIATPPNLHYVGIIVDHVDPTVSDDDRDENPDSLPDIVNPSFGKPNSSVRTFTFDSPDVTLSKDMLNAWKDVLDISKLESVKFSRGFPMIDYFENAPTMLPNLKHLSLNFSPIMGSSTGSNPNLTLQAANSYLRNCPPLQFLSLWSWMRVVSLSELLDRHASSLESLQLHEKEGPGSLYVDVPNTRSILSLDDLEAIRSRCTKLSNLTFDMNREDKDFNLVAEMRNIEYIKKLASFEAGINGLEIYFDSCGLHDLLHSYLAARSGNPTADGSDADDSEEMESVHVEEEEEEDASRQDTGASTSLAEQERGTMQRANDASPPTKKPRTKKDLIPPEDLMRSYVEEIWKVIFGARHTGRRELCIKFGEWESRMTFSWKDTRRLFNVRPHDRDDMRGECVVTMRQRNSINRQDE